MTSIFVAKLDFGITSEQLKQAFQQYGTVLKASVATDRETGKSRGFGFVEMADREEAMTAIKELDNSLMNGRPIAVKEAEQRQDNRAPRDPSAKRPEFPKREGFDPSRSSGAPRPDSRPQEFSRPGSEPSAFIPPLPEPLKGEPRKKAVDKDKKGKDWDSDSHAKKPKMNAYKKSGKNNRFFPDEDDDDWDINSMDSTVDEDVDEYGYNEKSNYVEDDFEDEFEDEDED